MKRQICLLSIISWMFFSGMLMIISCGKLFTLEDIYGVWKGEYFGEELIIQFSSDSKIILTFNDIYSSSIDTINGNFSMDFSKKPIPLSIINIPQLNHGLYTIVEFVEVDSIKLGNFAPRGKLRTLSFEKRKSINLKRINKIE